MKKAFTIIELIFVIIVIGIIASIAIPKLKKNYLPKAAAQVISHIRYTQHMALMDDKFDTTNVDWHRERWMIRFKEDLLYTSPSESYNGVWSYSIFSDADHDRNPDAVEMAINPLNKNQYLSGGYNNTLHINDKKAMKLMRLGDTYNIKDMAFGGGCRSNTPYIYFDHLGRPFNTMPNTSGSAYQLAASGYHKLLSSTCTISLCSVSDCGTAVGDEIITIKIEPETGYTHL